MAVPPQKFEDPDQLAKFQGTYIVEEMGEGAFGQAFLLGNNYVLKITRMREEWQCAEHILKNRLWEVSPHIPVVRNTGEIWMEYGDQLRPHYWYIRERLPDLSKFDVEAIETESGESVNQVLEGIIENLQADLGLEIRDARRLENWGKRAFRWRFEVVLRDLWCVVRAG